MLETVQHRLGHRFRDPALLDQALTHRSAAPAGHSERLEFLGDALLGFLVAERLCARLAEPVDEGVLTRRRQALVRTETLAACARSLALGAALRVSRGEESTGGREKDSLLADAFEAVLGAVYLDGGVRAARRFVRQHLGAWMDAAIGEASDGRDPKTDLQERVQARWHAPPEYRIVRVDGPPHARRFTIEVLVRGRVAGTGEGPTRRGAEQAAARAALSSGELP